MMQHEFEALIIPTKLHPDAYATVETVYAYHPMFHGKDTTAKKDIAHLYKMGGMGLMREMYHVADQFRVLEGKLQEAKNDVQRLTGNLTQARLLYQDGRLPR